MSGTDLSSGWRLAFKDRESSRVIAYMQRIWRELADAGQKGIDPSKKEPVITKFFGAALDDRKAEDGLESDFLYEVLRAKPDYAQGKLVRAHRTDIEYRTLDSERALLVFEFKKLTPQAKSRAAYLHKDGMLRFISGNYKNSEPVAFMAGLIHTEPDKSIAALKAAMEKTKAVAALKIVPKTGQAIREPSEKFPGQAKFDTAHFREVEGSISILFLSHMFFDHNPAKVPA